MKKLKLLRQEKALTQESLAARVGLTRQSISAYENCVATPPVETAQRIAAVLEVDWRELFEEEQK